MSVRRACLCVQERERWKEWVCVPCWATPSSPHLDNGPAVQETRRQQLDSTILRSVYHFYGWTIKSESKQKVVFRTRGGGCPSPLTGHWLWKVGPMMIWPLIQGATPPSRRNVFRRMDGCDATELHYVLWNLIKLDQPGVYFPPCIFFGKTTERLKMWDFSFYFLFLSIIKENFNL